MRALRYVLIGLVARATWIIGMRGISLAVIRFYNCMI